MKSEHSKDQQSSDSSHTVHKPTNNNDSTVTHTGQFSRPGFLRHPLRKAMSYVKPQPEPSVSVKSTTRRLQHTLTIERPDDRKFKPMSSKTSNRSSLRASANQSDFSNKVS
ncbi:unnamed protein product [Trichobilharzia regenti]|nr:unnamed protein product [Trichobilharzia regenti]